MEKPKHILAKKPKHFGQNTLHVTLRACLKSNFASKSGTCTCLESNFAYVHVWNQILQANLVHVHVWNQILQANLIHVHVWNLQHCYFCNLVTIHSSLVKIRKKVRLCRFLEIILYTVM